MLMQRICIAPLVASLLTSCVSAAESCQASHANPRRTQDATFPEPTLGVWMLGDDPCSLPGNYDSDGRIEIKKKVLIGYEQSHRPVQVQLISKAPRTWKVRSTIDLGDGPEPDQDKVFVVSAGMRPIADDDEMRTCTKCREKSDMSTEERGEVLPQSEFGAEAAMLKLLDLISGSKSIEDFTPERVSKVMGLQMHFDGADRFGAAETLTQDWSYGFYVNRAGLDGPLFLFSFDPRGSNKNPPATAICQFDFDRFARDLEGMGFSQETIYGEHGRLINHRFDRTGLYIKVVTEGEANDPVEKITHECVRIVVIR